MSVCQPCGNKGELCCSSQNTNTDGYGCMANDGGLCNAEGRCTGAMTGIGLKGACDTRGGALCDTAFKGLECVSGNPAGGDWCNCGPGSAGQACGAQMVCSGKATPGAPTGGTPPTKAPTGGSGGAPTGPPTGSKGDTKSYNCLAKANCYVGGAGGLAKGSNICPANAAGEPLPCKGAFNTAQDCAALCDQQPTCNIWQFSDMDKTCYTFKGAVDNPPVCQVTKLPQVAGFNAATITAPNGSVKGPCKAP